VELPFSAAHLSWIRRALRQVVDAGTGGAARRGRACTVAGKTGTAQNPHGEDHAWFMCYAPATAPEVAVAVILENAGSRRFSEAAPVAGEWLHTYFGQSEDTVRLFRSKDGIADSSLRQGGAR
jgi:penicillin-binding protein 2